MTDANTNPPTAPTNHKATTHKFAANGELGLGILAGVATYGAAVAQLIIAAAATDVFVLAGPDAPIKAKIRKVTINAIATAAGSLDVFAVLRSTADVGGTSQVVPVGPYSSSDGVPTVSAATYTANPTSLGVFQANLRASKVAVGTAAIPAASTVWDFNERDTETKYPHLNGVLESFAINLNGQTVAGLKLNIEVEWTEE